MKTIWLAAMGWLFLALCIPAQGDASGKKIHLVMDEREQMEVLARYLKEKGGVESTVVDQASVPADWTGFEAVIGYVHGRLDERVEVKWIEYAKSGGRLLLLHHSISGGKAANRFLFDFLGIARTMAA